MKKINIFIVIAVISGAVLFAFLGRSREISDCDIVSGVSIDKNQDKWFLTFEICKPSKDEAFASQSEYVKSEGFTLKQAFETASMKSKNILYTDSVDIFIVSDSVDDVKQVKDYFLQNKVNMRAVAVVCQGKASDLLEGDSQDKSVKSIFISDKIKRYCYDIKKPVPKIIAFAQNTSSVQLTKQGEVERSKT